MNKTNKDYFLVYRYYTKLKYTDNSNQLEKNNSPNRKMSQGDEQAMYRKINSEDIMLLLGSQINVNENNQLSLLAF